MGATTFSTIATGLTAKDAFTAAVSRAQFDYGHAGYTGSIAEKDSFVMIADTLAQVMARYEEIRPSTFLDLNDGNREAIARALIEGGDDRIDDKWGPAGCLDLGLFGGGPKRTYLFFGWASE